MDRLWLRIAATVAIPMTAFMIMATIALGEHHQRHEERARMVQVAQLALDGKALIHALQAERGSTVGYLSALDNDFRAILDDHRDATDQALRRYQRDEAIYQLVTGADLSAFRRQLEEGAARLETHRERVDRHALHPLESTESYGRLIDPLILIASSTPDAGATPGMLSLLAAYRSLLMLKEQAARERSLGSAWLVARTPDPVIFRNYLQRVAIQELQRSQFLKLAPEIYVDRLRGLEQQPAHQEVMIARATITLQGETQKPAGLSGLRWFQMTSERIDGLHQLERALVRDILDTGTEIKADSQRQWLNLLGITVALLILTLLLSMTVARSLLLRHRQHAEAMHRIQFLASHDALTGLPNRDHFKEHLNQLLFLARSEKRTLGVFLLDLEGFTDINRIWGESVADELLCRISARLCKLMGPDALMARIYGDQFGVVFFDSSRLDNPERLAADLLGALRPAVEIGPRRIEVKGNIGIVLCPPYPHDASELLAYLAFSVQNAKDDRLHRHSIFEPVIMSRHSELLQMDRDLEWALEHDEFELYYQPKVDLATGAIVSVEALLRWHHPDRGAIPPNVFIPRAEANGSIIPLGEQVLRKACLQCQAWRERGFEDLTMAVNLSAVQLYQANFIEQVERALADSGLPADALELELTESCLMEDMEVAERILRSLCALGVSLSVDDFGTGYSSLAYLRRFPVSCLKLDQRFVKELEMGGEAELIAGAVLALARSLSLTTVAEGVENHYQAKWLRERGCLQAQGYLYARPMPAAECLSLMQKRGGFDVP
ncbi:putative bifunctional diguanylate cyclase/phosphodiesterase [Ectothiorhodospira lacustris]|uniref:putative bifunctional diguanylate cyclase/phosphodiesterase n=1 Tax=Ectothiorhodospira lacustris TaxID=2899127 RepID=UPI001EE99EFD|nr:EAL domain-containing protein [Ectothiorhodospira lacustris]MCG5500579.1 EAL domain-containing protein [Ectothiorhodospira lacustris]MCG5508772.1 EAL domain-containing protein [Ectothiorhodospira lacustris]MCG5520563.1 EAL domain-containing protein [Ectothiorhodospira lacustris]